MTSPPLTIYIIFKLNSYVKKNILTTYCIVNIKRPLLGEIRVYKMGGD